MDVRAHSFEAYNLELRIGGEGFSTPRPDLLRLVRRDPIASAADHDSLHSVRNQVPAATQSHPTDSQVRIDSFGC